MKRSRSPALALLGLALWGCGGTAEPDGGARLTISVVGLPPGTPARIVVDGPRQYHADVQGSTTLRKLDPGAYRVEARYVIAQGQTWLAQPAADSVSLADRDSTEVVVTYGGGPAPTLDLTIAAVELVQSTQRPDGGVPMIEGREALLRVHVAANGANAVQPAVRVRLYQAAVPVDSFVIPAPSASVPTGATASPLDASWNALIPAGRVTAGLAYDVVVDPTDQIPEGDKGNNLWPSGGSPEPVTVQAVSPLSLRFVPVHQPSTGQTGDVTAGNQGALIAPTRQMFPLGGVTTDVRAPFTSSAPPAVPNDSNGAWSQILSEMNALRLAENVNRYYMGVISVGYTSGIAGLGYIGLRAAVTWDKGATAPGIVAHELGHNFGRFHSPCGNPPGPDPAYPYAGGGIGVWGVDVPAMALKDPAAYTDLMGYCNPKWISDYTYLAVLTYRQANPVRLPGPSEDGLLVWGRMTGDGIVLEPAIAVRAPPSLPERPGPYRIEGLDAGGGRSFSLSFAGDEVADLMAGSERHFAFVVPLAAPARSRLSTLRLAANGLTVVRSVPAALQGGARPLAPPSVTRAGTAALVRWDPAYPLVVVRDAVTGEILSFARGGAARVEAGGAGVTVQLSDGVTGGVIPPGP